MLYGYIVDQACIVRQTSCTRQGACLLYDSDMFRYMLHGVTACIKFGALIVYIVAFCWSRNKDRKEAKKKENQAQEQNEMVPVKS